MYVFFCPFVIIKPGFDHVSIHLDRVFGVFVKMAAEWPD